MMALSRRDQVREVVTNVLLFAVSAWLFALVFSALMFAGTFALRTPLESLAGRAIGLPERFAHPNPAANHLAFIISAGVVAAPAGLLAACWIRRIGYWQLLVPVPGLVMAAYRTHAFAMQVAARPSTVQRGPDFNAVMAVGFEGLAIATILAIVPAVLGAWLGTKLRPRAADAGPAPREGGPKSDSEEDVTAHVSRVWFVDDMLHVLLSDGRVIAVPVEWYPRLRDATDEQRNNWRLIGRGEGIHWEDVDEDISVAGLLRH